MTRTVLAATLLATSSVPALAGGLDRTGLPIDILFAEGNYAEFGIARTLPTISGVGTRDAAGNSPALDALVAPNVRYDGVGLAFNTIQAGVKVDINARFSAALLFDQPFGSDIEYNGDPDTTELGGTRAIADSDMITAMLRYKFDDNWSAHAGLRFDWAEGEIDLRGLAYGLPSTLTLTGLPAPFPPIAPIGTPGLPPKDPTQFTDGFNGYSVELDRRMDIGWMAGFAYEIPEIALRFALTYNSEITHDFDTTEFFRGQRIGTSTTEVSLPRSVNIDFQSGVAEDTLVFAGFRWAEWSEFRIDPEVFTAASPGGLVSLEDTRTWTLGVARRFTEDFAGRASMTYEDSGSDDLVSPLAPTNGLFAVGLGGAYDVTEQVTLSGGVQYAWLGNARPETGTPDTARAEFRDNSAFTFGLAIGYRF